MANFCLEQDITQVTLDAAAGEVTVTISDYGFPDIMLDSVAVGGFPVDPAFIDIDMMTGFATIVLDGNAISDYFGGDGLLDQNELETISFCFQVSECPPSTLDLPINPTMSVFSTCKGEVCGSGVDFEESGEIDISPNFGAIPDADFTTIQAPAACGADGSPQQFIFDIEMSSTVTDPLRGRFDDLRFLVDECAGGALILDSAEIFEGGTMGGALLPLPILGRLFNWI